jgi:hypothetical protein
MLSSVLLSIFAAAPGGDIPDVGGGLMAALWTYMIVSLVVFAIVVIGMYKVFEKAGQPGWAAIVPIYNAWILVTEIAQKPPLWFVGLLIPCVNIIVMLLVCMEVANKFGQGGGFGIGLFLLGIVFWPLLGFGSAQYEGRKKRRPRDDDDDDDRPRRRARDDDDDDDDRRVKRRPRDDD